MKDGRDKILTAKHAKDAKIHRAIAACFKTVFSCFWRISWAGLLVALRISNFTRLQVGIHPFAQITREIGRIRFQQHMFDPGRALK
jgi:hypothetical protein